MHSFAHVVPTPLFIDHMLIDLAGSDVVIFTKIDIQESLIIPEVYINFPTII